MKSSSRYTVAQQATATFNKLAPCQASATPATNAASPAQTLPQASRMAGKVITARVTYGTYYRNERTYTFLISRRTSVSGSTRIR